MHVDMILMSYWNPNLEPSFYKKCQIYANVSTTAGGRQGWQIIIPQKNAENINNFIMCFVKINKNKFNKKPNKSKNKVTKFF